MLLRRSIATLLAAALLVVGTGPAAAQETETYDVSGFSELQMSVRGTAYVSQGSDESLEITGPQKVLDKIVVEVRGDRLAVEYQDRSWYERLFSGDWFDDQDPVDVRVTMTSVSELAVQGAASIVGETPIEASDLRLDVRGAGDMELDLTSETLETEISGAGEMDLTGSTGTHDIRISGAGEIRASDLETAESEIRVSGAGECEVHATDRLDVSVSGAGTVRYRGQPKISQSISGAGSVKAM